MEPLLVKITAAIYLLAAASYFYFVFRKDSSSRLSALALTAGFALHTAALTNRFVSEGFAAVALIGEALLFKSWLMVALYLSFQLKYRLTVLGGIVAPVASLMSLAAFAFGAASGEIPPGLRILLAAGSCYLGVSRQRGVRLSVRRELDLSASGAPPQT